MNRENAFDLYRSTVCFVLTNIGCLFFIYHCDHYLEDFQLIISADHEESIIPQGIYNWNMTQYFFSTFILVDFSLMIHNSYWRKDLLIHHVISLVATFIFWNRIYLIHLSMLLESYSMLNSIRIIYPFKNIERLLCTWRIFCIISIRYSIYLYGSLVFYNNNQVYHIGFPFTFICLDTFWLSKNIKKFRNIR